MFQKGPCLAFFRKKKKKNSAQLADLEKYPNISLLSIKNIIHCSSIPKEKPPTSKPQTASQLIQREIN